MDHTVETFDTAETVDIKVGLIVRELIVHLEKMLVHGEIEKKTIFLSTYSRYVECSSTTFGFQIYQIRKT